VPDSVTEHGGGVVLPLEQQQGGGGVVAASPSAGTLPFTGSETGLLVLLGVVFLGLGFVLRRVSVPHG
jgi:LPXTG-motif cell wall-anchored protein